MVDKISFIGAGNMGGAIALSVCREIGPKLVTVYDANAEAAKSLNAQTGCAIAPDAVSAVRSSKYVILCVKPQILEPVIKELLPALADGGKVLASIAAGVSLSSYKRMLGGLDVPIIRIMPSITATVGKGIMLFAPDENVMMEDCENLMRAMSSCGVTELASEKEIDAGTAIYSCGPAFFSVFIEAMADAGVEIGLTRSQALRFASQTAAGTAEMLLETGQHPAALKDSVCSPGGSTIAGVAALERGGLRAAVWQAVTCAYEKTLHMDEK